MWRGAICTLLCWMMTRTNANARINGSWKQLYTNVHVDTTREIGWRCVSVDVNINKNEAKIQRHASLHGGSETIDAVAMVRFDESNLVFEKNIFTGPALRVQLSYNLHQCDNATWVVTGQDDGSAYVWTDGSEPVDIPRLLQLVGPYGPLVLTYDDSCC